ncbi:MAG: hypothetical protein PHV63_01450 [Candidatus Daviesbacteria bacterium]|nr:hypothetical protein [Candidatus Daviesbacteria bacterium]
MKRKITNKNLIVLLGLLRHFNKGPEPRFRQQARERLLEKISPRKRFWLLPVRFQVLLALHWIMLWLGKERSLRRMIAKRIAGKPLVYLKTKEIVFHS